MYMAHFDAISPLRTRRTLKYGFFTMLDISPNCTHIQKSHLSEAVSGV